jgi:hypothetical protein
MTTTIITDAGSQNGVENHKKIAEHLISAATHHFKAASHLQEGNHDKATQCIALAQEYFNLACEAKLNI